MIRRRLVIAAVCGWGAPIAGAQSCLPYWSSPGRPGYTVKLLTFDDGTGAALYATGDFRSLANGNAVARWRGQGWEPVGPGQLMGEGANLLVLDEGGGPFLYSFGHTNPNPISWWLKRWTGGPNGAWVNAPEGMLRTWNPPSSPDGSEPKLYGVTAQGPGIFGWSTFQGAGLYVSRWTGSGWAALGPSFDYLPQSYIIFDDGSGPKLYVAGDFYLIGGVSTPSIASWDGSSWQRLQNGPYYSSAIFDLCVFDDGSGPCLYIACGYNSNNPLFGGAIARWDGQEWSGVGGGIWAPPGYFTAVHSLAVFDDGAGPALYVAGTFTHAGGPGGVPVQNIAKWNGHQWSAVGEGLGSGGVKDMAVYSDPRGPSLFVAGQFATAGGGSCPSMAQWVGCPSCYANCDVSTAPPRLNVLDFNCFLNRFVAHDPYANCNGDAAINVLDFSCFLNRFSAGCP